MNAVKDRYDQEVEILTENPALIHIAWAVTSALFRPMLRHKEDVRVCPSCLTQAKLWIERALREHDPKPAYNNLVRLAGDDVVQQLWCDDQIPSDERDITVSQLKEFARWQRAMDARYEVEPPPVLTDEQMDLFKIWFGNDGHAQKGLEGTRGEEMEKLFEYCRVMQFPF